MEDTLTLKEASASDRDQVESTRAASVAALGQLRSMSIVVLSTHGNSIIKVKIDRKLRFGHGSGALGAPAGRQR